MFSNAFFTPLCFNDLSVFIEIVFVLLFELSENPQKRDITSQVCWDLFLFLCHSLWLPYVFVMSILKLACMKIGNSRIFVFFDRMFYDISKT